MIRGKIKKHYDENMLIKLGPSQDGDIKVIYKNKAGIRVKTYSEDNSKEWIMDILAEIHKDNISGGEKISGICIKETVFDNDTSIHFHNYTFASKKANLTFKVPSHRINLSDSSDSVITALTSVSDKVIGVIEMRKENKKKLKSILATGVVLASIFVTPCVVNTLRPYDPPEFTPPPAAVEVMQEQYGTYDSENTNFTYDTEEDIKSGFKK